MFLRRCLTRPVTLECRNARVGRVCLNGRAAISRNFVACLSTSIRRGVAHNTTHALRTNRSRSTCGKYSLRFWHLYEQQVWGQIILRREARCFSTEHPTYTYVPLPSQSGFVSTLPRAAHASIGRMMQRYTEVQQQLERADTLSPKDITSLSKEAARLEPAVTLASRLSSRQGEVLDLLELMESEDDSTLLKEVRNDMSAAIEDMERIEQALIEYLVPLDDADERNAILEVRAGAGGEEASLFSMNLFHMYEGWAQRKGWSFEVLDVSESQEAKGFKEASALISSRGGYTSVFGTMKYETGVHRVQRVPSTEKAGRIHTSTMTVAVMPEAQEVDIDIKESDLRIDVFRSSGPGGQSVNTMDSAVRLTHLPTGVVVQCQNQRSQILNKQTAMKILNTRLYQMEYEKQQAARKSMRQSQIGRGERSERIRTYNFPQDRITDHRINLTLSGVDSMLTGDLLDDFVAALRREEQVELLQAMADDDVEDGERGAKAAGRRQ